MELFFRLDRLEIGYIDKRKSNPLALLASGLNGDYPLDESEDLNRVEMVNANFGRESMNGGHDIIQIYMSFEEANDFQIGKEYKFTISE